MMKSHLDYTQHEAQNARNLLRWEQEVFSWADYWQAMMCGVPQSMMNQADVVMVQRNAAGSLGVSPSCSSIPQDRRSASGGWGLRG